MRAMLETFPWSPDIRQGHFERAADAVIAALRSESPETPSGEGEASRRLLWEAARVLGEIGGALEGPHDSVDWGVLRTDLRRVRRRLTAAALRSEWRIDEPAREIARPTPGGSDE